ncbi:amino acid ABC transporter substrate-binding protein (PAAT family) [Comamonas sp. 26]|nr:amino acid ABC transporter substrate-binding protein (PAAT family) [Comamonas sp. 26]
MMYSSTRQTARTWAAWLLLCLASACCNLGAQAGTVLERVQASGKLKVCIWPAYQGISWRDPRSGQLSGLDIDLARGLAADLRLTLQFVDSSFPSLVQDLLNDRCDVAMFGIAMLRQRMEKLQFSTPYLQSDIYAISTRTSRVVRQWSDIDQPGVLVGVQAGTFMEPVMQQRLRYARLVSIELPRTRERELHAGRVDVFMTDYPYGRTLIDSTDWALLLTPPEPFYPMPYAHASKPGDLQWQAVLNTFVARIQQDGRLDTAARRHGLLDIVVRK